MPDLLSSRFLSSFYRYFSTLLLGIRSLLNNFNKMEILIFYAQMRIPVIHLNIIETPPHS